MKNIIIITAEAEKILNGIADIKERKTALDAVEKRMKEKHIGMITGTDVYTTFLEQGRLDTPDMFE